MAGAAIISGIALMAGGLILFRSKLAVMVCVLLRGRCAVRLGTSLLRNGGMAVAARRLHGDRNGQRIAAEERQPDGQHHCDEFSDGV